MRHFFLFILAFGTVAATSSLPAAAQSTEAHAILRRAIEAQGGTGSLNRLKSPMMWMERGTFHGMGEAVPFVAQYAGKWPDWYRQEIENAFTITANGDKVWVENFQGVRLLHGEAAQERLGQIRIAWAQRLFPLTDKAYTLSTIDGLEVNGIATVGIRAVHPKHRDVEFYFDKESYLLVKTETRVISPQTGPKPVLSETFYSDHKSISGIKMPSKVRVVYAKKLFYEGETVDYKMAATLDPNQFRAPE